MAFDPDSFLLEEDEQEEIPQQPIKAAQPSAFDPDAFLSEEDDESGIGTQASIPYQYDKSRFLPKVKTPEEKEIGTLEGIANAAKNAFDSSRQAMDVLGGVTPEEAKNISKIEYDKQSRKLAPGYDEYQKAEGMDAVWAFAKNPIEVTSNIIAEGLAGSLPALGAGLAAGGAGALIGAPTGIGAPIGFTAGQIAGTFAGSLATEYGGKILEEMQNEGMDIQDPESIQKFFSNQTLVDAAKDKALKRGVPIAAFDAISAGIGGKLGRVIGKQFVTKTGEAAAELGVQAGLGGGGEVAGALAAGEPIEGKAVFGEIIGEAGPGAAEIITGRMADRAARVKAEEDAKIKAAAELSTNLEENNAPLTAVAVKSTTATTIEQDKLAAQLEEQLDAEELVAVKEPTAAPPAIKSKEEFTAIYSQVAPEELDAAEAGFTNVIATATTEEARANAQNALEAIKEVKATVTPPAPQVEPTITPAITPAVATAQPPITDATQEIIQPEGVRPELETGTQIETEETGVSDSLQPPARGEEEGQVIFGLRSVADNTATREQISALSEAGLVDIVKGKPVINEDGAAILAQPAAPAIVEQELVTTPALEEAVTPAPIAEAPVAAPVEQVVTPPVGVAPAPAIEEEPMSVSDEKEFAELNDLMERKGQAENKVRGVKFTKQDQSRYQNLVTKFRDRLIETTDPKNDPVVGTDINGTPIQQSNKGTFYTFENGRVRTGPAFSEATPAPTIAEAAPVEPITPAPVTEQAAPAEAPAPEVVPTLERTTAGKQIIKQAEEGGVNVAELNTIESAIQQIDNPQSSIIPEATTAEAIQYLQYTPEGTSVIDHLRNLSKLKDKRDAGIKKRATAILEKLTPAPAVSETITEPAQPTGIAVGNRIKLGKSPQTYTIEEVIPQSANDKKFGEQYYNVKNEKTGETQVVEKNDMKPVGARKRRMAAKPTPLPDNERYGQVKLNRRVQSYFGGKIPDRVYVVDDAVDEEYEYKAAYYPDEGILILNNAFIRKNENIGDIIAHELGHYAFGDAKFKAAFDEFYNSLTPEEKADIDQLMGDSYNNETEESQMEEKKVIAFTSFTIATPQRRSLWNAVLDAMKAFLNRVFGKNFKMSDPTRTALAMLATAKRRFAAGEEIVREDIQARKMAAQTQDARFAELEARAKAGDKEAEAEAQRMVDEAAKAAVERVDALDLDETTPIKAGEEVSRVIWGPVGDVIELQTLDNLDIAQGERVVRGVHFGDTDFWTEKLAEDYGRDPESATIIDITVADGDRLLEDTNYSTPEEGGERAYSGVLATARTVLRRGIDFVVSGESYINDDIPPSADPFTYDDAGNLIPLSERFQPTTPDIRRMAAEAEPRREQVAGRTDRGTDIITTPVGIIKQTNEVLRKNFFDGTTVSDEATKNAWLYISRLLDIESGNANELAGEINDVVDAETNSDSRMGASLLSVSLTNYAANLAAQGDSTMLSFLVRRVNRMPVDKYAGGRSDAGRALRAAREYDIDGYGALKVEQDAKRDRTTAEIFATANPTEQQVKDVSDAIDAADNATIGTPEEVASDVEKIEKRTKRNITKKLETLLKKGSLKEMIASIKNTPLEEQQAPGWIEKVIKGYLEQAGLTGDAATTAAKLYDSILTERFVAAKQKAFEETLKRSAPWNNYLSRNSRMAKDSLKKIQVAIRTGVLDPSQTIESVIAKENGWDGFTKEQFEKIVQLDNIINNPDNDDVTRREAMSDLNKIIVDAKLPVRFKDALGAYYVGNALMGIPTVTVNIASPIGFTVRNMMTDIGRYAFTDPARIPIAFESFLDSMRSWYDQTSYAFKNQIYLNDVVEYLQGQNVLRELFDKGKKQWANGEYAAGFVNMAVGMTQITGRVLSSLDQGAIAMLENQNITRYAMEALAGNTKGRVPKDKLKEFANMVLHTKRRVIAESIASGMPRDRAGVLADLAVKSEIIAALSTTEAGPRAVLDAAINDALLSVGRNKAITIKGAEKENTNLSDEGMLSYLPISFLQTIASGAARQGSAMQIFSKMLYGFALVPARVFHNVAWFSPYGFIRLGVDKYKKSKGQDSPYAMSLQTDAQFKQRLTEAIAGSIVMLGLAALRAGSSDDEDDKKFKIVITGNGPSATTDRQYYDSWNKKWKPYSIHIVVGDTIIPINIGRGGEALFFPIMLAGAMDDWEIKKKQNDTKKEPEDLSMMASMLGSSFFALAQRGPYAAFTKPLFDASKEGRVTEELASQAGYFGKTFIPLLGTSVARNITDFINDPVDRSSIEGAIYANTPIVGPWMGAKALNALGQPVRADDWGDKLYKLGVPVVFSFPKNTPMNELNELILKQGSGPTIPTRTNAQKRFGDILTDQEFETYVREYGKVMSDRMFKNRTKLARMKPSDYDDELEKYARGYSAGDFKIKGASDAAVQAVKRMRQ